MRGMKTTAIKAQPCQNLSEPAGINNIAAMMIKPRKRRTKSLDLRLISIWHSCVRASAIDSTAVPHDMRRFAGRDDAAYLSRSRHPSNLQKTSLQDGRSRRIDSLRNQCQRPSVSARQLWEKKYSPQDPLLSSARLTMESAVFLQGPTFAKSLQLQNRFRPESDWRSDRTPLRTCVSGWGVRNQVP